MGLVLPKAWFGSGPMVWPHGLAPWFGPSPMVWPHGLAPARWCGPMAEPCLSAFYRKPSLKFFIFPPILSRLSISSNHHGTSIAFGCVLWRCCGCSWCPTPDELKALWEYNGVTYMIIGFEIGANGTPHFQGYMELEEEKRRAGAKPWGRGQTMGQNRG